MVGAPDARYGEVAAAFDEVASGLPEVRTVWRIELGDLDKLVAGGVDVPDAEIERRRKLATGGDTTVKIWDATPLTPESRASREARGVVEFLSAQSLPKDEILARIRRDPTLSEPARQRALELARQAVTTSATSPDPAPGVKNDQAR